LLQELLDRHHGVSGCLGAHDVDAESCRRPPVQIRQPVGPIPADLVREPADGRDQHHRQQDHREEADEVDDPDGRTSLPAALVVQVVDSRNERQAEEQ
jgi:hypothetical protein